MLTILENEEQELKEIDLAIERIENGSYGTCEECSCVIDLERLAALPFTRLCVDCKRLQEENNS